MKIAFVCNEYPPASHGGIGTFVQALARKLVTRGHAAFVLGYDTTVSSVRDELDQGVSVTRLPVHAALRLKFGRFRLSPDAVTARMKLSSVIRDLSRREGIDIVESYDWSGPLWSAPGVCPLVVRLHGANTAHAWYEGKRPSRLLRSLERRNVRIADHLVAVSEHIREVTLQALDSTGRHCDVVYNGVDTSIFYPLQQNEPEVPVVLFVGKLHARKGVDELLGAWAIVSRGYPRARLKIVGAYEDPSTLQRYADKYRFDARSVELTGFVSHDQLPRIYNACTAAVFPSRAEAFGLTCAEAMACGCAVVMTSRASGPELVENDLSGLLANPENRNDLASAITRVLADRELRLRLGRAARDRVKRHFDLDVATDRNLAMYAEVIERRQNA